MINGADLRDFYIAAWRSIPELVAACGDDEGNIRTHAGVSKVSRSLQQEIEDMPEGSIMVAYQGNKGKMRGRGEITSHEIAAFVRPLTPGDDVSIAFFPLMIDAIPDGEELSVRRLTPHPDADPMDMPRCERVGTSKSIDIWKVTLFIPENFG